MCICIIYNVRELRKPWVYNATLCIYVTVTRIYTHTYAYCDLHADYPREYNTYI